DGRELAHTYRGDTAGMNSENGGCEGTPMRRRPPCEICMNKTRAEVLAVVDPLPLGIASMFTRGILYRAAVAAFCGFAIFAAVRSEGVQAEPGATFGGVRVDVAPLRANAG